MPLSEHSADRHGNGQQALGGRRTQVEHFDLISFNAAFLQSDAVEDLCLRIIKTIGVYHPRREDVGLETGPLDRIHRHSVSVRVHGENGQELWGQHCQSTFVYNLNPRLEILDWHINVTLKPFSISCSGRHGREAMLPPASRLYVRHQGEVKTNSEILKLGINLIIIETTFLVDHRIQKGDVANTQRRVPYNALSID